jgi:hypothetical protein
VIKYQFSFKLYITKNTISAKIKIKECLITSSATLL